MASELGLTVGSYSDKGRREVNQDCCGIVTPRGKTLETKGIAVAIADGMSACAAGKEAAERAVKGFLADYFSTPETWTAKTSGQKVLGSLNAMLYRIGEDNHAERRGLVTTFSAVVFKSNTAHIFHVGDSRIYRLRGSQLTRLTKDHRVWVSDDKSYLSRAVGVDSDVRVDYKTVPLKVGDRFILSTDGVHDFLSDDDILQLAAVAVDNLDEAAEAICDKAYKKKSGDNLTCQIVEVTSLPSMDLDDVCKKLTELPFPPELYPNMEIDGYKILEELHLSSRSQLYIASEPATDEKVVIKTPSVNLKEDLAFLERFLLEEWAGKRLDNSNVMKIKDVVGSRTSLYYVTEHIAGRTLRQWMDENSKPDIKMVGSIIHQLVNGLRGFQRKEMVHRDLKPENIIIDNYGLVKIIDFGSVKIGGIAEISSPIERDHILGTMNYTSPEYFLGSTGTDQSDFFSLGVIVYEMLTGKLPYGEQTSMKLSPENIKNMEYTPAYRYNPMVPVWMDGAIKKMVATDPRKRYEVLSEFEVDVTKPNRLFMKDINLPIAQKYPLGFWRTVSGLLLVGNLILGYLLLSN